MKNSNSFPANPDFSVSFLSQTQWLRMAVELTRHISTLAQFSADEVQKIALALDEAVTNVIKHSYHLLEDQEITVEYYLAASGMKIRIIDAGTRPAFKAEEINLEKMIKRRQKGGLGVGLMKRIMDSVEYRQFEGKNICEMVKWLNPN